VLLESFAARGPAVFAGLRGMFALCLWDRRERRLWLARDPYGIKPLYLADEGGCVRVASEARALRAGGQIQSAVNAAGLCGFLLSGCVPEPFTLQQSIRSLPPGSVWCADERGLVEVQPRRGLLERLAELEAARPERADSAPEFDARVRAAVLDSVRAHTLSSDVPVGLFLSAGVDSTALAALMREVQPGGSLTAITLSCPEYEGRPGDELPLARQVAHTLRLEHRVVRFSAADFEGGIEGWLDAMDLPTTDGLNTYLVSRAARAAGLTVVLSGLGGDELLGGYPSFRQVPRLAAWTRWPGAVPGLAVGLRELLRRTLPEGLSPKWAAALEVRGDPLAAYALRRGLFLPYELPDLIGPELAREGLAALREARRAEDRALRALRTPWARLCALESTRYMRDQLLRDSDRASMAHGLELRVPLVDVRLLEALAPSLAALGRAPGKGALQRAARPALPEEILTRKKTGFRVPLERFLAACPPRSPLAAQRAPWARRLALELCARQGWMAEAG
jgi:asparagine synthase (glutamine-hydrolysing)